MMSDRAISDTGTAGNAVRGTINYHSVWTAPGEGWAGGVLRNDGSVSFSSTPTGFTAEYGTGNLVTDAGLFDTGGGAGLPPGATSSLDPPRLVLQNSTATVSED